MPVKRKTKPVLKEGEVVEEERRPPVTQVVEVVEDHDDPDVITAQASSMEEAPPLEETVVQDEEVDEKRRVLVDELFDKKERKEEGIAPEISIHKRSPSGSVMTWAIVSIVACLVVGGGLFLLSNKGGLAGFMAKPTPTPTATPAATPTPAVTLARDAVTLEVLNGGGVAGAGGKMKAFLEDKGYTVKNTGNADNYDHETTEIYVKAGKEGYVSLLEEDLKESYSIGTTAASLAEDGEYDVQVIVGKE